MSRIHMSILGAAVFLAAACGITADAVAVALDDSLDLDHASTEWVDVLSNDLAADDARLLRVDVADETIVRAAVVDNGVSVEALAVGSTRVGYTLESDGSQVRATLTVVVRQPAPEPPIPEIILEPTEVVFGQVEVGESRQRIVKITKPSDRTLTLQAASADGFTVDIQACRQPEPAGTCEVTITFAPAAPGTYVDQLVFDFGDFGQRAVLVFGIGTQPTPETTPTPDTTPPTISVRAVPTALDFGLVEPNSNHWRSIGILNEGNVTVTIPRIESTTGLLVDVLACPSLAPGERCEFLVSYRTGDAGPIDEELVITADPAAPIHVPVTGRVGVIDFEATPDPILIDQVGDAATLELTNSGDFTIGELGWLDSTNGDTATQPLCENLAPKSRCEATLANLRPGRIVIIGGGAAKTITVQLRPVHALGVDPVSVNLGLIDPDSPPSEVVTVRNEGNTELAAPTVDASPNLAVDSTDCAEPLQPGETCDLIVSVGTTAAGEFEGTIDIAADPAELIRVPVTGRVGVIDFEATPDPIEIDEVGDDGTVNIENFGDLTIDEVVWVNEVVEARAASPILCENLEPEASCVVTLTNLRPGPIVISGDGVERTITVELKAVSTFDVEPRTIDFGLVPAGSLQSTIVTVTNNGNTPLPAPTGVGSPFVDIDTEGCPRPLQPRESCTLTVSVTMPESGDLAGAVAIVAEPADPALIPVSARSGNIAFSVTPVRILLLEEGESRTMGVRNIGDLPIDAIEFSDNGTLFSVEVLESCENLAVRGTCSVVLHDLHPGTFVMTGGGVEKTIVIELSQPPDTPLATSPDRLDFGDVAQDSSASLPLIVTNIGDADLPAPSVASSSSLIDVDTDNCGDGLRQRAECKLIVSIDTARPGERDGEITISDESGDSVIVTVTGRVLGVEEASINFSIHPDPIIIDDEGVTAIVEIENTGDVTISRFAWQRNESGIVVLRDEGCADLLAGTTCRATLTNLRPGTFVISGDRENRTVTVVLKSSTGPRFTVTPGSIDVGLVSPGSAQKRWVRFTNTGDTELAIPNLETSPGVGVASTLCAEQLQPLEQCLVLLSIDTSSIGAINESVTFSADLAGTAVLDISGATWWIDDGSTGPRREDGSTTTSTTEISIESEPVQTESTSTTDDAPGSGERPVETASDSRSLPSSTTSTDSASSTTTSSTTERNFQP